MNANKQNNAQSSDKDSHRVIKVKGLNYEFEIHFIALPPERREAYFHALRVVHDLLQQVLTERTSVLPICSECGCYLHLREDGKEVCRTENCPNYS